MCQLESLRPKGSHSERQRSIASGPKTSGCLAVIAPRTSMQQRDKQVILIQCNTFRESQCSGTTVYESQQPRGVVPLCKCRASSGATVPPSPGSTCPQDQGEARGLEGTPTGSLGSLDTLIQALLRLVPMQTATRGLGGGTALLMWGYRVAHPRASRWVSVKSLLELRLRKEAAPLFPHL